MAEIIRVENVTKRFGEVISPTTTLPSVGFKYPIIVLSKTVFPDPFLPPVIIKRI